MKEINTNPSILIADHTSNVRLDIENMFKVYGFKTWGASSGTDTLKKVLTLSPQTIIMELSLPGMGGLDVCRELRQVHNNWTPIIFVSERMNELDTVLGLELGADDYMTKPLRLKELVARVKSIHRRGHLWSLSKEPNREKDSTDMILNNGDLVIDVSQFIVYKAGEPIEFTRKEFELLYYFFQNKGKAFSRKHLLNVLSKEGNDADERIIDVFISRIRQKIEPHHQSSTYIRTVRNVGYMMMPATMK